VAILIGLAVAVPSVALADGGGYVFRQDELPPLQDAQTTLIQGKPVTGGCEWPSESDRVELAAGETWEIRDIAVDLTACRKIRESGTPTVMRDPPPVDASTSMALPNGGRHPAGANSAQEVSPAATGFRYVIHRAWWSDAPGFTLNYDETRSSWVWEVGGCVLDGNGYGDWGWLSGTGWRIISYGGSTNRTCSRFYAVTYSHFRNTQFCSGVSVDTYYSYVRNYGYNTGSFVGTRSSDTYRECLPVFFNYQITG
jgi:hypothetical protein